MEAALQPQSGQVTSNCFLMVFKAVASFFGCSFVSSASQPFLPPTCFFTSFFPRIVAVGPREGESQETESTGSMVWRAVPHRAVAFVAI